MKRMLKVLCVASALGFALAGCGGGGGGKRPGRRSLPRASRGRGSATGAEADAMIHIGQIEVDTSGNITAKYMRTAWPRG